jgi:hypothetical protein
MPAAPTNPYKGPFSFDLGDAYFYGRDRETREVVNLLTAERVVLLHAPAGAGKTSLIQAALIPALAKTFSVLPLLRVSRQVTAQPGAPPVNRYVLSVAVSLFTDPAADPYPLAARGLGACLDQLRQAAGERPQLLILDQFEELLTLDQADRRAKQEFFEQLGEALRRVPAEGAGPRALPRWALFSMRDEYVAAMSPYFRLLPEELGATYRLDVLNGEQARDAIRKPAKEKGVTFADGAAETLVRNLGGARDAPPSGEVPPLKEVFVEPVQLQVVCYRLWEQLWAPGAPLAAGERTVTVGHVKKYAEVDNALAGYYRDKVREVAADSGANELDVRLWFEHRLITRSGARAIVQEGQGGEADLDPAVVEKLGKAWLVRRDQKGDRTWLELAHDRLIEPVHRDNEAWLKDHLVPWQLKALDWERHDQRPEFLLRGVDLTQAEAWVAANAGRRSRIDKPYLEASRNAATTQDLLRGYVYRWWALIASGACLLLVVLLAALGLKVSEAREQTRLANRNLALFLSARQSQAAWSQRAIDAGAQLQANFATRQRIRPLQPGLSIGGPRPGPGHATAGVLTAFVRGRRDRKPYLLTLPGALAPWPVTKGMAVYQPSWLDRPANAGNKVATVWDVREVRFDAPNQGVWALAELDDGVRWEPRVFAFGAMKGAGEARPDQSVLTVGRDSVLTQGTVTALAHSTSVKGLGPKQDQSAVFQELLVIAGRPQFAKAGDMGAPVLTPDGALVGVLFALGRGEKEEHLAYALPILPLLNELNVDLIVPPPAGQKAPGGAAR